MEMRDIKCHVMSVFNTESNIRCGGLILEFQGDYFTRKMTVSVFLKIIMYRMGNNWKILFSCRANLELCSKICYMQIMELRIKEVLYFLKPQNSEIELTKLHLPDSKTEYQIFIQFFSLFFNKFLFSFFQASAGKYQLQQEKTQQVKIKI